MTATASNVMPLTPDRFVYDLKNASQANLSPNGQRVTYVVTSPSRETNAFESQIWLSDIDGTNQRQLTWRSAPHSTPVWSPDGESIAYVSSRTEGKGSAIFVLSLAGGEPREITAHAGTPSDLAWSPDGTALAYILTVDPENPTEEERPADAVAPIRIVKRPDYKQDGRGFVNDVRLQLFVVDLESGIRRQLTTVANDHSEPRWHPDGSVLGVQRLHLHGLYEQLVLIDLATGAETVIGKPTETIRDWRWTPDAQSVVLIQAPHYAFGASILVRNLATGEERTIAQDLDWSPIVLPGWVEDTQILVGGTTAGRGGLWTLDITADPGTTPTLQTTFSGSPASFVSGHPTVVLASNAADQPGELAAYDLSRNETTLITHLNDAFFAATPTAQIERRSVENEGFTIEYWLTKPANFDPSQRYPVVLDIHGGPHGTHGPGFNWTDQVLAASGYLVVSPNPRGSSSYTDDFTAAVLGDWGGGDWRDDLAALDDVLSLPYADSDRTGIFGYSYGGYMSAWAIGQTTQFKAAVIGAPITDLIANYGTADIGHYGGEFQWGGKVADIWDRLQQQSPITYAHKATTPALLLHPEEDQRCPISGSEQLFISLLAAGVETELVRYPGQSHGMMRSGPPEYRVDFTTRMLAWFNRFLQP